MSGTKGHGNSTAQRGRPPVRRVALTMENARRMASRGIHKGNIAVIVNLVIRQWLDERDKQDDWERQLDS